jgi:hypothetical protein
MLDQRRHQRIRFRNPPPISVGFNGVVGVGCIENISLSGLMFRTGMVLEIGKLAGCEFSLFGSPPIDVPITVVSKVGDMFGARFQTGPINQVVLEDALSAAMLSGEASTLGVYEINGRKVMRIAGGLNGGLRSDFMHMLTRVGVDEIDVAAVTAIDQAGLALCLIAVEKHQVSLGDQSTCFVEAWQGVSPGGPGKTG